MSVISANNNVSVDCVVLGFDGCDINVLLVRREGRHDGEMFHDMKLPGGLIFDDENLDSAAARVLHELTGLSNVPMAQFRSYGSAHRTDNKKDVLWLENVVKMKISRVVTVAYVAAISIDEQINNSIKNTEAVWTKIDEVPSLAFDHNTIVLDALQNLKNTLNYNGSLLFSMLPEKFTIQQFRMLLEALVGRKIDNANIYKKIAQRPYIVPLEEKQTGGSHRAARYYAFDKPAWESYIKNTMQSCIF